MKNLDLVWRVIKTMGVLMVAILQCRGVEPSMDLITDSKRLLTYSIERGYRYSGISLQKEVITESLAECMVECSLKATSCFYINYDVTSKLCSVGDCNNLDPVLLVSVNHTAISKSRETGKPSNCLDIQRQGLSTCSGVYTIYVPTADNPSTTKATEVYCDMETDGGGWLVFQRRTDGSEDFYREWDDYKNGFGNVSNEFWLGNDDLHQILNNGNQHELRIELGDFNNETRFAKYSTFNVANEADNYRLTIGGYSGDAGDSMISNNNGIQFSTMLMDHDTYNTENCAAVWGGPWWYSSCSAATLNSRYLEGVTATKYLGIVWESWKGDHYSLKFTEMKLRPKQ